MKTVFTLLRRRSIFRYRNTIRPLPSKTFVHASKVTRSLHTQPFLLAKKKADSKEGATDLIYAASIGDLAEVQNIVESTNPDVSIGDYDQRSPLHLAAAGGFVKIVDFLLKKGANLNAQDRWGNTPLSDAVNGGHDGVIRMLREAGVNAAKDKGLSRAFLSSARDGDVNKLKKLLNAGVDINCSDSDSRTALHDSAALGLLAVVDFLLSNGARVNVSDAWGNTPLINAKRGESKQKREIVRRLKSAGAVVDSDVWQLRNTHEFRASIVQSLPLLCARGNWDYAEVWIPTDDQKELLPFHESWAAKSHADVFAPYQAVETAFEVGHGFVGSVFASRSPVWLSEVDVTDLGHHASMISSIGINSGLAIPIIYGGRVLAVIAFFSQSFKSETPDNIGLFSKFANGLIASGLFHSEANFEPVIGIPTDKMKQVFKHIVNEGVFNAKIVYQEVDWFFRMGIPSTYFEMFDASIIAQHVHSFMAAKKLAQAMGKEEAIYVTTDCGSNGIVFMCPATYLDSVTVEQKIENYISEVPDGYSFNLTYLCSNGTSLPQGKNRLSMYIVQSAPYVEPKVADDETNIWHVASGTFLRNKSLEIRSRYQETIRDAVGKLEPIFKVYHQTKDGTTPVILTIRHSQKASFLQRFTEVLKFHQLNCSKKFIETFSNGIVVYSFYLASNDTNKISQFLDHIQLLCVVPGSSMRGLFLDGTLTVEEYAFAASLRKFIYYFLNQRSEEFEVLARALKGDTLNLGRLNLLQTKLRREAVSLSRISKCIEDNIPIIHELYHDFLRCARVGPKYNKDLEALILKQSRSDIDSQILISFLVFNSHLLKTNFWKPHKAALSFSLDPKFVTQASLYPENPYCIFFVLGQEFQGFHIRFRDIARGGIRVIKSAHKVAFLKNMEGQFAENYDLALTQNKKNKDIPEFGSKGTVLLYRDAQGHTNVAFKKYVAGILDLLVSEPNSIVDHYQKEELLFLGPDEYTADLMEWAAKYSQTRGYRYWKAFTTGKPRSLGGVPHDMYGMTTRGVRRYVIGCLAKLGLKEEEVTKFQTGGPDGDLGSNEILLSNEKTIGVVDGSGVLFDPVGINKEELTRLAQARKMIDSFDTSKLGSGGFRVLVTETDVKLPSGEIVESGLAFRNDFHVHPLSQADLFVPCGGRPASINLGNVNKFLSKDGKPKYKIIVEGANLFLTQDARLVLENAGVVLYKDASANKGGVTSSSLEVLAALVMTDAEHLEHMQVKDPQNVPLFYQEYVKDIQNIIAQNADLEFQCIWKEHVRTGMPRCVLTDKISDKINSLNDAISASQLYDVNKELRNIVMSRAIPKKLQELVPVEDIIKRLPDTYGKAIFGAWVAAHFVYEYGLNASEFSFFEFIASLQNK